MIKLILSILGPVLFLANYWVCELVYPGSAQSWDVFIPMDKLCHNFWAVTICVYSLVSLLPTTIRITRFFILTGISFSAFDVWARLSGMCEFVPKWYILSLILSLTISGIIYGYTERRKLVE